jgi:hypothetical protein
MASAAEIRVVMLVRGVDGVDVVVAVLAFIHDNRGWSDCFRSG